MLVNVTKSVHGALSSTEALVISGLPVTHNDMIQRLHHDMILWSYVASWFKLV